jgi:hypothetical protein
MQDKASWQKRSFSLKPISWNNTMTQTTEMRALKSQLSEAHSEQKIVANYVAAAGAIRAKASALTRVTLMAAEVEAKAFAAEVRSENSAGYSALVKVRKIESDIAALKAKTK